MVEDEKVKKWLEEQEKIKSELSILAGSLKGTRHAQREDPAQQFEDSILKDAKLKDDASGGVPPKAPEEVYVAEEFKFPEKKTASEPVPQPPSPSPPPAQQPSIPPQTVPKEPAVSTPKLKPTVPLPQKPVAEQKKVTPPAQPKIKPAVSAQPSATEQEFSEIISYIEEKISKTPEYINFDKAQELLEDAIKMLNAQNPEEALKYAKYSQKEVKKVRLRYLRIKKLMRQVKKEMIELKKKGINIKVQKDLLSQAQIALKTNNFQTARDLVNTCLEENSKNL